MDSGHGNGGRRYMSDINVTPLVDVVIVLLIIFMIAAPMLTKGLDVRLPKTTAKSLPQEKKTMVITVNRKGKIYLNKVAVDRQVLRQRLAELRQKGGARQVFLRADRAVPYGVVAGVVAAIREAGIENLGLVTRPLNSSDTGKRQKKPKKDIRGDIKSLTIPTIRSLMESRRVLLAADRSALSFQNASA